jgi:hypothetical protein
VAGSGAGVAGVVVVGEEALGAGAGSTGGVDGMFQAGRAAGAGVVAVLPL